MFHKIIVLGAGAAGVTAAIEASDSGCDVAILEGNDRVLKKILSTGNGRCNISNLHIDIHRYHSTYPQKAEGILKDFSTSKTFEYFEGLGLPLITLEDNKIFPMSLQASSVIDVLRMALRERNIPVYLNSKVKAIKKKGNNFILETKNGDFYKCEKLIICCGGCSAPNTGSDGSGFNLSKSLGHNIVKPLPALVQLKLSYENLKALQGVKIQGSAKILVNNEVKREEEGEILFTDYGISGPPILQLSRIASKAIEDGKEVSLSLNMFPHLSLEELKDKLLSHFEVFYNRSIHDNLIGILNKKLIPTVLKECGIKNIHEAASCIDYKNKIAIFKLLNSYTFKVIGTNSFKESQVTAGGVDMREVNSTLMSKLVKDLYFAGEILDIDGDCGGFNLQWAWSSGYTAGKNASHNA